MMNRFFLSIFLTGFISLCFISCGNSNKDDKLLATVNGEKLYISEIYFPSNMSPEDSVLFLKQMVDNWVVQQLMYLDAEEKLTEEAKSEIDKKVENARKLLVIAAMEENLVSDSTQVAVKIEEAQSYYQENPDEFLLKENVVKVRYLKLNKKSTNTESFKSLLLSDKPTDRTTLNTRAKDEALNYFLEDNVWLYFNDILKEIPIKTDNQEDFLKKTKFHEISTDSVVYLVRINGYMLTNSTAPFALVKDRIISILEAKKKTQLLDDYRNKIYENALKEKKVTLYTD